MDFMHTDLTLHPTSTTDTLLNHEDSNVNMEIRLACVEDGLENMGFRKFACSGKRRRSPFQ